MFKVIFSFSFSFFLLIANAQQEQQQNIWLFGTGTKGIKFDPVTHIPSVTNGKYTPYGNEGCGVATNPSTGALLFYSDGVKIIDASNQIMPNGSGLQGHSSSAQNAWICGVPGNCNQYYIFSSAAAFEANASGALYYSIVDMTLPGNGTVSSPKGDVVSGKKNILINSTGSEALTIIKSANNSEYWMLSIEFNTTSIRIYKITATGIQLSSTFTSSITFNDPRNIRYSEAAKKFSITSAIENVPVMVGDFNPSTGTITSFAAVPGTPFVNTYQLYYGCYDSEWSADGTKLYIGKYRWQPTTGGGRVYQYDFSNPTASPKLIFDFGGPVTNTVAGLKRGPDKKIYVLYNSDVNGYRYIGRIENPNAVANNVVFTPNAVDMGTGYPSSGKFPEFMIFDNHKPVANVDDKTPTCISQPTDINVLTNDTDPDNNTLSANIIRTYKGTSTLNGNGTIHYVPLTNYQGNDTIWYTACDNACVSLCDTSYVLICNPRICSNDPPVAVTDVVPCFYMNLTMILDVLKNDSDPDQDSIYISSVQSTHGTATIYQDTLIKFIPATGFTGTASITYTVCDTSTCNTNNCTQVSFDLCIDPPVCINATPVSVTDAFPCIIDTTSFINLDVLANDSDPDMDPIHISAARAVHGNVTVYQNTLLHYVPALGFAGNDTITYTICDNANCSNSCIEAKTVVCIKTLPLNIPNLFTPNGDNHNDVFFIEGLYPNTRVSIYNRWGELIYDTNNYDNSWGKNDKVIDGMYYCHVEDTIRKKTYKSWIQVLGTK
jgi:gliding motility-associated-like protein